MDKEYIITAFVLLNLVTLAVYGYDKFKAKVHGRRVPENTLISLALVGGAFGALAGMVFFHHKTQKLKFRLLLPVFVIVWIVIAAAAAKKLMA